MVDGRRRQQRGIYATVEPLGSEVASIADLFGRF